MRYPGTFLKLTAKRNSWIIYGLFILAAGCQNQPEPALAPPAYPADPYLQQLTEAIAADPDNPELYYNRALQLYDQEGYDQAIKDLLAALRLDSTRVEYYHLLADAYLDYFQSRNAIQTMEKVVGLYPERIPSLLKLSEFQLILEQHDASMRTIDRILRIDPQNAEAYFMFGMNFKEIGDTARAINSFQTAVEYDPELIDGWINLGQLQAALGNSIAAQYFESALQIAPRDPRVLHAKAFYLLEQGDLTGSLELFRQIARNDPQYSDAYYNAGLLLLDLDSLAEAKAQFDLAIKTSPLHIRAYYYRGLTSEFLGNPQAALADYRQALQLAPDYALPREGIQRLSGEE